MSNPVLRIQTTGHFSIATVGDMLSVDLSYSEFYALDCGEYTGAMIGPIGVTWMDPKHAKYPMFELYDLDWTLILEFRCPGYWSITRSSLMITLFELMILKEESRVSDYLAWLDTGEVLFFLKDGHLRISQDHKKD